MNNAKPLVKHVLVLSERYMSMYRELLLYTQAKPKNIQQVSDMPTPFDSSLCFILVVLIGPHC